MDKISSCFLNILRCALKGCPLDREPGLTRTEWEALFRLASIHKVLPMVYETVHALPELRDSGLLPAVKQTVFRLVMAQAQKSAEFLSLMDSLSAAGVRPLVVKGIICRSLYPHPDHRVSSDEDLLIHPGEAALCHRVFRGLGLETGVSAEARASAYEIPYRQTRGSLYIELHRYLFPPESASYGDLNRFFRNAAARAVEEHVCGTKLLTLEYTDHLFYLICHAFKHFLHSGFGIRQVCDIVRFAEVHGQRIDWVRLELDCRKIRAHLFAAAIFRIGRNCLGFDPAAAHMPAVWQRMDVDEGPMLEDLLRSGVYGSSSRSRQHSSAITLDAVAAQKQGRTGHTGMLVSLFPSARKLSSRYPYLEEKPWLLPAAWASRIGSYCAETLSRRDSSASQALEIGSQRLQLLKQYGILK